jgi:hypothetical protein
MPVVKATTPKEEPTSTAKGFNFTVAELLAGMVLVSIVAGGTIAMVQKSMEPSRVRGIIEAKVLTRSDLKPCTAVINTERLEGVCGEFGKYTVLSGGTSISVFTGTGDQLKLHGQDYWFSEELTAYALGL